MLRNSIIISQKQISKNFQKKAYENNLYITSTENNENYFIEMKLVDEVVLIGQFYLNIFLKN
jgi:hypothetical protein